MNTSENGWERVPANRIRMQVASFLAECGDLDAINRDSLVDDEQVSPALNYVARVCRIKLAGAPQKPRHGWKVSTLVGFIEANQAPPDPQQKTAP